MERLFAQPIAREYEFALRLIVNRKTEHAAQFLYAVRAHLFIQMNDDFGISLGVETMTALFKLQTKFRKVINLAVKHDPCAAIFVEDRLVATGKINDAKPPHPEPRAIGNIKPLIVRTAVHDLVAHVAHERFRNIALASCADHSRNSTHGVFATLSPQQEENQTFQPQQAHR